MDDLADAHRRDPHAALRIDRQSVRPTRGHFGKDAPVLDAALVGDVVDPHCASGGIRVIEMFSIGAETEAIADLDSVPQFHRAAGWIDAEQAPRYRLVVAERIEVDGTGVNAAVIVGREIVHADRLAFPRGEQIAALAGLLIPMNQAAAGEHEPAALVEDHSADALALGNQRFDVASRIAPVNAAVGDVAEIQPAEIVDTRRLEQAVAAREHFEFHRSDPPPAGLPRSGVRLRGSAHARNSSSPYQSGKIDVDRLAVGAGP